MAQSKRSGPKSRIADSYIQALVTFDGMSDDIAKQFKDGFEEGQKKTEPVSEEAGKKSGSKFAGGIVGAIAASGAAIKIGEMFGDAINSSLERLNVNSKLGAALALDDKDLAKVTDVAKSLYNTGIGDSYEQVADTMKAIVGTVKGAREMNSDELKKMGRDIINVGATWDLSAEEVTTAASAMINNGMASNFSDAVSQIAAGFQVLGGHGVDWLDTVNEFGGDMARFGFTGTQAINFMSAAIRAGVKDTDKLGDSLNELSITIRNGSIDDNIKALGVDPEKLRKNIAEGGNVAREALIDVLTRLQKNGDINNFQKLMSSLGEDYKDAFQSIDFSGINAPLGEAVGNLDKINEQMGTGVGTSIKEFQRTFEDAFITLVIPILQQITPVLQDMVKWFKENEGAVQALAIIVGVIMVAAILLATFALIGMAAAGWAAAAPILAMSWPILLVIAAVVALVAAFWWMSDQFGGVTNMMSAAWQGFTDGLGQLWKDIQMIIGEIGKFFAQVFNVKVDATGNGIVSNSGTSMPMMADGGTIPARPGGTAAILGEAGKSEVVMDSGKWNTLLDKINNGELGQQGGNNITFEISTRDNESAEEILAKITDHLDFIGMR